MKICFLIHSRYGIGGVISSTARLASALSARHDVEVVSLHRDRDTADIRLDPAVRAVDLLDWRPTAADCAADDPLSAEPPRLFPAKDGGRTKQNSRLVEVRLARYLAATDADVVIATHPGIGVVLGKLPGDFLKIAQIHQASNTLFADQRRGFEQSPAGLDAMVSVNSEDSENLRRFFPWVDWKITAIPNCVEPAAIAPSDTTGHTLIAAGRLEHRKHYDELLRAFDQATADLPEWRLRIYGRGDQKAKLAQLIKERSLEERVLLMGATSHMDMEWPKAAIAVSASSTECLPMNLIEAMSAGVPVVSADCDYGPREIITDGEDGILVPIRDVDAMAGALLKLMTNPELRAKMGAAAQSASRRYLPSVIASRWEALLTQLAGARTVHTAADVVSNPGGDLHVELPQDMDHPGLQLRCVARTGSHAAAMVDYAFLPTDGTTRRLRATIPARDTQLGEGQWSMTVHSPVDDVQRLLRCHSYDNRFQAEADQPLPGDGFRYRLAFPNDDNSLVLHVWDRPRHAEARMIKRDDEGFTTQFEMWGAQFSAAARVLAVARVDGTPSFEVPLLTQGERYGEFTVPYAVAAQSRLAEHDVWDLHVDPGTDELIPIGRFFGDFPQVKQVYDYAPQVLDEPTEAAGRWLFLNKHQDVPAAVRVRPFFTVNRTLALNAVVLKAQ
ncbi:glycosyltransferase family 4 protein [Streptomyces sp. 135]|uniref:glycosyltransferase family 4 protein n=1 Tax=Streptomyces sp. 135 TaxID=2838850 RepID=UPI001CBE7DF4|nr:glycosyltransferase family 4 protein [Streptomyces sp. 135]